MKNKSLLKEKTSNLLFFSAIFMLGIIGLIFIYSASNYSAAATYGDKFYFVKKQAIGLILGTVIFVISSLTDYNIYKKINIPLAVITIVLLLLVFVNGIGVENYGAKRWIGLGSITIQPSEIAKFSLILFSATYISKYPEKSISFFKLFPIIIYGIIICLLIMLEPNMSITVCVVLLLISMLFAGGMKIKTFLLMLLPIFLFGVVLILIEPYRMKRLMAFLNPWENPKGEGYQLLQSLYALGSGGLFGVGLFNSRQKFAFLPFSESDFILSIIGEEIGFFGLLLFFCLYFFIVLRGLKVARNSKDVFGFMLATGISMIIGIQAIINALVVSGSIPPTGLPLPLVSSGNTSIIIFMAELGILINISKQSKK